MRSTSDSWVRLRSLAATVTMKAINQRVLQQAQDHAQLIGLADNRDGRPD